MSRDTATERSAPAAETRALTIGRHVVVDEGSTYLIAELGNNHQGQLDRCLDLVNAALDNGANAVKLQRRTLDACFTRAYLDRPYAGPNSFGSTYGEHRSALELSLDELAAVVDHVHDRDADILVTAFDEPSVDDLVRLGVDGIKIASGDLTNTPLIERAGRSGLPVVVSTGAGTVLDVDRAVDVLEHAGAEFALLQCTAVYPSTFDDLDLAVIGSFRARYPSVQIGYSGHEPSIEPAVVAVAAGARIVEQHATLDRGMRGTDHAFSLEPGDIAELRRRIDLVHRMLGSSSKRRRAAEDAAIEKMGKSIVAAQPLAAGTRITAEHIAFRTPGGGLPPYAAGSIIGRTLDRDIDVDTWLDADAFRS